MSNSGEFPSTPVTLEEFLLLQAKRGYGGEQTVFKRETDGSQTIEFEEGPWRLVDNFFTSEDGRFFFGHIVIFRDGKPYWYEQYDGRFSEESDLGRVNAFLHQMLQNPDPKLPIRGPVEFAQDDLYYDLDGTSLETHTSGLHNFDKEEYISVGDDRELAYVGHFRGGLI